MKKHSTKPSPAVRSYNSSHLSIGELVEARQGQELHHRGPGDQTHPDLGLFWVQDTITGMRRIVDFDSYEVFVEH